jgi:hypothetical protein
MCNTLSSEVPRAVSFMLVPKEDRGLSTTKHGFQITLVFPRHPAIFE